jgi:hypothetical protein
MKEIQSLCLDVRLSSDGKFTSSTVLDATC